MVGGDRKLGFVFGVIQLQQIASKKRVQPPREYIFKLKGSGGTANPTEIGNPYLIFLLSFSIFNIGDMLYRSKDIAKSLYSGFPI